VGRRRLPHSVLGAAVAATAAVITLTGCASTIQRQQVQAIAVDFVTAVQNKNGQDACSLLTPNAAESVSGATDIPCSTAVLNVEEDGSEVRHVQIWGDAAQVKLGGDTVFLSRQPAGWQVRAAGCQSQPGAAYHCDVEG
jgi:hypothetical protein